MSIVERFAVSGVIFDAVPRYNIAPTQPVSAILAEANTGERFLDLLRWGLVPFWAKDIAIGSKMINARAETVAEKPSFRTPFKRRRCLIPSDGFYEWDKEGGTRQPYHFRRKDGELFGFAGLWDEWTAPDGSPLRTCTILTTTANPVVAPYHDRMPVILTSPDIESLWLDPSITEPDALESLLVPYPPEWMEAIPVSKRVNSPVNEDSDLVTDIRNSLCTILQRYGNEFLAHR
jgi:putative SOS response-associated peptidase YedK